MCDDSIVNVCDPKQKNKHYGGRQLVTSVHSDHAHKVCLLSANILNARSNVCKNRCKLCVANQRK